MHCPRTWPAPWGLLYLTDARPSRSVAITLLILLTVGYIGACASGDSDGGPDVTSSAASGGPDPRVETDDFGTESVEFVQGGRSLEICLLVADTPDLRRIGLSGRDELAGYGGMLFDFEEVSEHSFWMSETLIPLDLVPVDSDGEVIGVIPMDPCPEGGDCRTYSPGVPYDVAVELPMGELADRGISPDAGPIAFRRSGGPCSPSSEGR